MKFNLRSAALLTGLLLSTAVMAGHDQYRDHEGMHPHHMMGHHGPGDDPFMGPLAKALHNLDLSDDQKEAIHAVFLDNKDKMEANREADMKARKALHEIMMADKVDQDALKKAAHEIGNIAENRVVLGANVASQVMSKLTDEQRTELHSWAEQHHPGDDEDNMDGDEQQP